MARFRLLLEYEGTRYHGWQINPGQKTIQGEMLRACQELFNTKRVELYGAGRTDAGVHALGQTAHLVAPTILPYDIHVTGAAHCDSRFHARHSAVARSYVYVISRRRSAFGKRYVWWVKEDLSTTVMQEAAMFLKGFHDFSSFGAKSGENESPLAEIIHIRVIESGNMILLHIIGSHFLWMMVRRITGALVHCGKGKLALQDVKDFLDRYSERPSQLTAPPSGLYLERVYYPGESFDYNPQIPLSIV
jgi:tRNA pseudouridine38-40 synthase